MRKNKIYELFKTIKTYRMSLQNILLNEKIEKDEEYDINYLSKLLTLYKNIPNFLKSFLSNNTENYYKNKIYIDDLVESIVLDSHVYKILEKTSLELQTLEKEKQREIDLLNTQFNTAKLDAPVGSGVGWMTSDVLTAMVFSSMDEHYEKKDREKYFNALRDNYRKQLSNITNFYNDETKDALAQINFDTIIYRVSCDIQKMFLICYFSANNKMNEYRQFVLNPMWEKSFYDESNFSSILTSNLDRDYSVEKIIIETLLNPTEEKINEIYKLEIEDIFLFALKDFKHIDKNNKIICDFILNIKDSFLLKQIPTMEEDEEFFRQMVEGLFGEKIVKYQNIDLNYIKSKFSNNLCLNLEYKPLFLDKKFLCTCGTLNNINDEHCSNCKCKKDEIKQVYDSNLQEVFKKHRLIKNEFRDTKTYLLSQLKYKTFGFFLLSLAIAFIVFLSLSGLMSLPSSIFVSTFVLIVSIISMRQPLKLIYENKMKEKAEELHILYKPKFTKSSIVKNFVFVGILTFFIILFIIIGYLK